MFFCFNSWILYVLLISRWLQICAAVNSGDLCTTANVTKLSLDKEKVVLNDEGSRHYFFDVVDEDLSISVTPDDRQSDPDIRLYGQGSHRRLQTSSWDYQASAAAALVGECTLLLSAQDYGGDFFAIPGKRRSSMTLRQKIERMYREFDPTSADFLHLNETISNTRGGEPELYTQLISKYGQPATAESWEIVRYHLHVRCPRAGCKYHLAIGVGDHAFEQEEIKDGETKSGLIYHGVQHHFFFECTEECAKQEDVGKRLTFSAWPRDATSDELELLVRKDLRPTTITGHHMTTSKGWFGGKVVTCKAEKAKYYITVMKKHGRSALPFVVSVNLPTTLQELVLGRPIFGATSPGTIAYYRFEVKKPDTDIEVYLTSISGDADLLLSHSSVDTYPTVAHAQWSSKKVGDDEIVVPWNDTQRALHPTGWFHIGVRGYRTSAYSLIALAEEAQVGGKDLQVITWTELWLGLPQVLSAEPYRQASFLFYNQLHSENLYLHLQTLDGTDPSVCMQSCGPDPHQCAYISAMSLFAAGLPDTSPALSHCDGAKMEASSHLTLSKVGKPCSACWYSILVTSSAKSRFRIMLSADGTAQPLIAGEPFKGYVDVHDSSVLLVYYLSNETMTTHLKGASTLRISLTPIFGDPQFAITRGSADDALKTYSYKLAGACVGGTLMTTHSVTATDDAIAADNCFAKMMTTAATYFSISTTAKQCALYTGSCSSGDGRTDFKTYKREVLFSSQVQSQYDYELKLTDQKTGLEAVGAYFIRVWAASLHSQYRIQVFWEHPLELGGLQMSSLIDGLPLLEDGRMVRGALLDGSPDVYLFSLGATVSRPRPDIAVTIASLGTTSCHIAAMVVKPEANAQSILDRLLERGQTSNSNSSGTDQGQTVWKTFPGEQLLNIRNTDPGYAPPGKEPSIYAIAVLPVVAGVTGRLEYQIEAASSDKVLELQVTGMPIAGQVAVGDYRKYKVVLTEGHQHLAVSLTVLSGDANLYIGIADDVSNRNYLMKSDVFGSDSLFLSAYGDLMASHCSDATISASNECSYFIAVYGADGLADYRISAMVPSGMPVRIAPGWKVPVILMRGAHQYFYFSLEQSYGKTVQVILDSGSVRMLSAKFVAIGDAAHPTSSTLKKFMDGHVSTDVNATHFAGVWSLRFSTARMAELCTQFGKSSCAVFMIVEAQQALEGKVVLIEDPHPVIVAPSPPSPPSNGGADPDAGRVSTSTPVPDKGKDSSHGEGVPAPSPSGDEAVPLESGVPSRAELKAGRPVLFSLNIQEKHDISLSVSPLAGNCKPRLQVEFPAQTSDQCHTVLHSESPLGYISETISATHACFREGVFVFRLDNEGSMDCVVDFRALLLSRTHLDKQVSVLMLDSPVLVSDNRTRLLLFMSRVENPGKATDRERLTVRITEFTNDLDVGAVFLTARSFPDDGKSKEERLAEMLNNMGRISPTRSAGAPSVYSIHGFSEGCGDELVCQVIVRIRPARSGRFFDCLAVATDDVDRRHGADTLVPGVPLQGWIDTSQRTPLQYQMFVNNPRAVLRIRLTCMENGCGNLHLSADARLDFPQHQSQRAYNSDSGSTDGIELTINPSTDLSDHLGACKAPCILTVRVDAAKSSASTGRVNFLLTATQDSDFTLLLDGADPVEATANTGTPALFLFDSRRSSPLLTVVVTLPHDSSDPFGELVSVWGLGCDSTSNSAAKSHELPSRENHDFRGFANPRNQIVALVAHSGSNHCYYRIALVSHRLVPLTFSIRGFDWHEMSALPLGEPLNGVVDSAHRFSYLLDSPAVQSTIALSMEVCHGDILLETGQPAEQSAIPIHRVQSGFEAMLLPAQSTQWLQISSNNEASYILIAERPQFRQWLGLAQSEDRSLYVDTEEGDGALRIRWQVALLYGAGLPPEGRGSDSEPEAWYEVFYLKEKDAAKFNISTPCGLYEAHQSGKAHRKFVKSSRELVISDLDPAATYDINVVARNTQNGRSFAYTPYRSLSLSKTMQKTLQQIEKAAETHGENAGDYWIDDAAPLFIICLVIACCCWARPCCKNSGNTYFDMELPRYNRGGSRAREYMSVSSGTGSYAPPSIVGSS